MYINCSLAKTSVNFKAALSSQAEPLFSETAHEAKEALGISGGISMLDIPSSCFHQKVFENTGVGKLDSDEAMNYLSTMKTYTDINAVKVYPSGKMTKHYDHYFGPYNRSALTLGEDNINLFKLSTLEYGKILKKHEAEKPVLSNKVRPSEHYINYENELGTSEDYPVLEPLRIAFENFKNSYSCNTKKLKEEFELFKSDPLTQNYDRLAIYPFVKDSDPFLFKNFDKDFSKQQRFDTLKKKYADEIEFFKFNQFLAQKQQKEAKDSLNKKGIDLVGDCLIGFSESEQWAFYDAFDHDASVGWGLPVLDYSKITDENSAAHKLFKDKISFFLKNYDGIRFDVGWSYVRSYKEKDGKIFQTDMQDNIFKIIEKTAYDIKGKDYDTKKLMYEMEADSEKFSPFVFFENAPPRLLDSLRTRVGMYTTEYAHTDGKYGYGSVDFFKKMTNPSQDEFIAGTNNHDGTPLRVLAEATDGVLKNRKDKNISSLSKSLNLSAQDLQSPKNFVKAKFAELFTAKNQFLFFIDLFGGRVDINNQTADSKNFRYRLSSDYEKEYHSSLQNGDGFNLMESLKIAMESSGVDKKSPDIYKKVCIFSDYLRKPGAKTKQEADSSLQLTGEEDPLVKEIKSAGEKVI